MSFGPDPEPSGYPSGYGQEGAVFTPAVERELTEEERIKLTEDQQERIAAERRAIEAAARRRLQGLLAIAAVVILSFFVVLPVLGFQTGLFVWFFNLAAGL